MLQWFRDAISGVSSGVESLDGKEEISKSIVENSIGSDVEIKKIEDKAKAYEDIRPWILSALNTTIDDLHILKADGLAQGLYWLVCAAAKDPAGHINGMTGAASLGMLLAKETGVGVTELRSLFNSVDGILKLLTSPTVGKMLQDEDVWKLFLLKQDKIIEHLKSNKTFLDSWMINAKDIDSLVPSLLLLMKEASKNLANNRDQAAAFIAGHSEMNVDEKFLKDGIDFGKLAQMTSIVAENGHLKKDFMVVAAAFLPYISTLLKDKARIYIPQLTGSEALAKVEALIPDLVADIAVDIPGMISKDPKVESHAMREITRKALSMDLTEVAKILDEKLIAKYLADVSEALKTVKDKSVGGMAYVESYVSDEKTRVQITATLKRLLPKVKALAPEIMKLYDFAMLTTPAQEEDTKKMLEGGLAIAKELTPKELEMVVGIEVERYMAKPTSKSANELFPKELRSELMPFISEVLHDALKKGSKPLTAEYLAKYFHGEILASDFTFDLIDLFKDELQNKEVADRYFEFFKKPQNKENFVKALQRALVNNPELRGKEKQIADILSDPKKIIGLADIYKNFREGNYGKLTFQIIGAVVLPWRDGDIRGTLVFVIYNYVRSFVIDYLYPSFIRNKIYGKFANQMIDDLSTRELDTTKVKLKDYLHSKVTMDSVLSFRKQHLIASGSFKELDITPNELKNISFEGLNFTGCIFFAEKIHTCSFVGADIEGAKFRKVKEIYRVEFDVAAITNMLHALRKREKGDVVIDECEIKFACGKRAWIVDNKVIVENNITITPAEFEMLSAALKECKVVTLDEENRKKLTVEATDKLKPLTTDDIASLKLAERDGFTKGPIAQALLDQIDSKNLHSKTHSHSISVA